MKAKYRGIAAIVSALAGIMSVALFDSASAKPAVINPTAVAHRVPVPFIENIENTGRLADRNVRFIARTFAGVVYVTQAGELIYNIPHSSTDDIAGAADGLTVVTERMVNANPAVLRGIHPATTRLNFFYGRDTAGHHSNVPVFNALEWQSVYPGINLGLRAYDHTMEKIFVLMPGADPRDIIMEITGAGDVELDATGKLLARVTGGEISFSAPVAYQLGVLGIEPVSVRYELCEAGYGFIPGAYDPARPLIIDPLLGGTYLGGHRHDTVKAIALDAQGRVYVTGSTSSTNFPFTPGAYQTNQHGIFISLFDNDLTNLIASTFLGGSGYESANAIALDATGRVYITGDTSSTNFPTTPGAYQSEMIPPDDPSVPNYDAFVAVLSADLSELLACTLLGGDGQEWGQAITLDAWTNVYVAGRTPSTNFPTTAGAFQSELKGDTDGFIAKFNSGLTDLRASTYLGGDAVEIIQSIQLNIHGSVYVGGITTSTNFPATNNPYAATLAGETDCFIACMDNTLATLQNATYLGGATNEWLNAMVIDSSHSVYVAGFTYSSDFPTTQDAYQRLFPSATSDVYSGFITKFDSGLHGIQKSTFLGGSASWDAVNAMELDSYGNVWLAGQTASSNFPTTAGAYQRELNIPAGAPYAEADAFVACMSAGLGTLHISTLVGGSRADYAHALQRDTAGNVFAAGYTESWDFPTAPGAYERNYHIPVQQHWGDAFIVKFDSTLGDFPAPPIDFMASDRMYPDRIRLSWTASDHTDGYTVWRSLTPPVDDATLIGAVHDESTSFIDSAVTPGTVYYYWVRATNSSGTSAVSKSSAGRRSEMVPVAADFDGDGKADPALVSNGYWRAWMSGSGYGRVGPALGGNSDRFFAAGDFDGDGKADPAILKDNGALTIRLSASQYSPGNYQLSHSGEGAVVADFDGDGKADPAMYHEGMWYIWMSSLEYRDVSYFETGIYPDSIPLAADFDGDGFSDPAMFNPVTGEWVAWLTGNWWQPYRPDISLSVPGGLPAVGDFDGDGRADIAACDVATGEWYLWASGNHYVRQGPFPLK